MTALEEYIGMYGYHFNKKLYEFAVSQMKSLSGGAVNPKSKEEVAQFLTANGVTVKNNKGWDVPYVHAMLYADCWGSSYKTEKDLAQGIKDFLDDPDGNPTKAFDHYVIDHRSMKEPIFFDEML